LYYVFYKTTDVFKAEEMLVQANVPCSLVPTPVQDKAYCGVCLRTECNEVDVKTLLTGMNFKLI
jgi:hypothetical protein